MRKLTTVVTLSLMLASPSFAGGVSSISENGSVSGNTAYRIQCSNGQSWRIWRSSGQWWDGSGAQGGQPRNLNEQAAFLCR